MEKYREILLVLSSLGVLESIFFGIYLLTIKGEKKISNILLSILIFALAIRIGKSILLYFSEDLPTTIRNIGLGAKLAIGPALYLHIQAFAHYKTFRLRKAHLLHFIPFCTYAIAAPYVSNQAMVSPYRFILLQFFVYLVLSFVGWLKAKNTVLNTYESIWIRNLVAGVFLIWLSYTLHYVRILPLYITGAIIYSFVVYGMIYLALKRNSIFVASPEQKKYKTSKLAQNDSVRLLAQIITFFDEGQPFLDAGLTLDKVAKQLNVSPRSVSQVINEQRNQNFSDFINSYRIIEAQRLLHSNSHENHTIASIAYESGFNSLSAFNTAFKKNTRFTPSAYRKMKSAADDNQ